MDYIEGESLDKILKQDGAQLQEIVIDWAKQLCDALRYLHSQNPPIIYRDMKPANVMLKPEGNLKVIDFGIAREYKQENMADTVSLGTKGYRICGTQLNPNDNRAYICMLEAYESEGMFGKAEENGFYSDDVSVSISVKDPKYKGMEKI